MNIYRFASAIAALALFATATLADAQSCATNQDGKVLCAAPDSTCIQDPDGDVICSPPGGGLDFDLSGKPACGPGVCTRDRDGLVFCSSLPKGGAASDRDGNVTCTSQCVRGNREMCIKPL